MKEKLFSKDFTLMVVGQVVSLFGNAAIRFALPLYLLNQTGSSALYGTVSGCALLPVILLSPIGGMIADRVNKRNIMVALDFGTAAVILTFLLLMERIALVPLLTVVLMLLYGISGAYQPSVQASVPALVCPEQLMAANSVINTISSFASLLGPVLGGILYSAYGLKPVLVVCGVCFFLSAGMELWIRIPFTRQEAGKGLWRTARSDFAESLRFIRIGKPAIGRVVVGLCGINLFLSALTVGTPYLITEVLELGAQANRLYGFEEGVLAAGGLVGGVCAGVFADKLAVKTSGNLIVACAAGLFPIGAALLLCPNGMAVYLILTVCSFWIIFCATILTVQMMSYVQAETPEHLIGKVIAVIMTVCMCAQPLGNTLYGVLYELCAGFEFAVVLSAGVAALLIAGGMKKNFKTL